MTAISNLKVVAAGVLLAVVATACGTATASSEDVRDISGQVEEPRIYPPTNVPVVEVPPRIYPPTDIPVVDLTAPGIVE